MVDGNQGHNAAVEQNKQEKVAQLWEKESYLRVEVCMKGSWTPRAV